MTNEKRQVKKWTTPNQNIFVKGLVAYSNLSKLTKDEALDAWNNNPYHRFDRNPFTSLEINHAEIRPFGDYNYEDFKLEFDLGRFLKDGTKIPIAELMGCTNVECKYNINGKCWNSNYSYNCQHRPNKEENCNE